MGVQRHPRTTVPSLSTHGWTCVCIGINTDLYSHIKRFLLTNSDRVSQEQLAHRGSRVGGEVSVAPGLGGSWDPC